MRRWHPGARSGESYVSTREAFEDYLYPTSVPMAPSFFTPAGLYIPRLVVYCAKGVRAAWMGRSPIMCSHSAKWSGSQCPAACPSWQGFLLKKSEFLPAELKQVAGTLTQKPVGIRILTSIKTPYAPDERPTEGLFAQYRGRPTPGRGNFAT